MIKSLDVLLFLFGTNLISCPVLIVASCPAYRFLKSPSIIPMSQARTFGLDI